MGRVVSQSRCSIVRECANEACIFKMLFRNYKVNPVNDMEKRRNAEIERMNGKGFYPQWKTIGKGELVELSCNDYQEKK